MLSAWGWLCMYTFNLQKATPRCDYRANNSWRQQDRRKVWKSGRASSKCGGHICPFPPVEIELPDLSKSGGQLPPCYHLVPTTLSSDVSAHYYSGQSWRDVMSTFMEWIWRLFLNTQVLISGTKGGSFACGCSLCDRGRVASVICKALGGARAPVCLFEVVEF